MYLLHLPIWTLQHSIVNVSILILFTWVFFWLFLRSWNGLDIFLSKSSASSFTIISPVSFFRRISNLTTIMNCTQTIWESVIHPQFCPFHTMKAFHFKSILMMMLMNLFSIQRFISNWKCQNMLEFFRILRKWKRHLLLIVSKMDLGLHILLHSRFRK